MSKEQRGYIWGKRIAGDIGGISSMIDPVSGAWPRLKLPAVNLTGIEQDYDEISATQNYALGSRMVVDERVFHYARAGAAIVNPYTYRLSINADLNAPTTWGLALPAPGILVGDTTWRITHANFGVPATTVALNELAGGWVEIWPAAGGCMFRRILSNTASAAGVPAYIDIVVDRPADIACAAGAGTAALHRSAYNNVQAAGLYVGEQSAVGIAPVLVTNGWYFWLQTYGPCVIAATGNAPGFVANSRDVYLWQDGTICDFAAAYAAGANISPQRIGYVMGASTVGDGNNDIMLQLAP